MKMNVSSKLAGFFFFFLEIYYGENLRCWGLYLEEEVFTFCKQVITAWKMGEIINSFFLIIRICTFRGNFLNLKILLKIVLIIS